MTNIPIDEVFGDQVIGYKTKKGSSKWAPSTVLGIIKNEKYKGDVIMGKTFTVDPISKRRLENFGEEDKYQIHNHHEPIISEEVFEKAQEILKKKAKTLNNDGIIKREKYSRKYAFSSMLCCGFCNSNLSRRMWHSSSKYQKVTWQCVNATKKGKTFCPDSKGVPEKIIEDAFIESFRILCGDNKDVLDEFLERMKNVLSNSNVNKQLKKIEKEIFDYEKRKNRLIDMLLDKSIDKKTHNEKYAEISEKLEYLLDERERLQETSNDEENIKRRLNEFRLALEQNEILECFERSVFESIIEKVIIGGIDEFGNKDPYKITFVYKIGYTDDIDGRKIKERRKNENKGSINKNMCSYYSDHTRGDSSKPQKSLNIIYSRSADG
ncbi:MAG: recombinase family protein [Burkholderiales bacterium]